MLLASEDGTLWHQVESEARERGGFVAFKPLPSAPVLDLEPPTRRALISKLRADEPAPEFIGELLKHLCTADVLFAVVDDALTLLVSIFAHSHSLVLKADAAKIAMPLKELRLKLRDEYAHDDRPYEADVTLVGQHALDTYALFGRAMEMEGDLDVEESAKDFFETINWALKQPICVPAKKKTPFAWWAVPLVAAGLALVIWHETK